MSLLGEHEMGGTDESFETHITFQF